MREIVTYYSTFFILSTYISIIAVPLCLLLQKKNLINTKNSLGMIYTIIFSALLISVLNPQSRFLVSASEMIFADSINSIFSSFREHVWTLLVYVFGADPKVYTLLMSLLGIACAVGAALYLVSLLIITIKINKLENFKRIGKLRILVDQENVTPHVFSLLNKSYVVIPKHVIEQKEFLKTAISHELQHIRNGDTHSIYLWQFFKCLLWVNPFIHIILSYIKNLQELRVDENLIHDKKINYKIYLKTLSWFVSEGRPQPRYALSHSIFGWSTFKELKMRITNIHRVRPMRSQPLFCLFFLAGNIFALLVIGNSSPKFQYSLYEVQRMYMPEYMKTEFLLNIKYDSEAITRAQSTLEFTKEKDLGMYVFNSDYEKVFRENIKFKEIFAEIYNKPKLRLLGKNVAYPVNYDLKAKVIEYSDEQVILQFTGSFVDIRKILSDINKLKTISAADLAAEHEKHTIHINQIIKLKYNEVANIENLNIRFNVIKKLVPKKSISFFPNIKDQVAEEKSGYESKL